MIKHTQGLGLIIVVILTASFLYKALIPDDMSGQGDLILPEVERIMKERQKKRRVHSVYSVSPNATGSYLSSFFAQNRNDWTGANQFLQGVLEGDADNIELVKRSMILAVGASNLKEASKHAEKLLQSDDDEGLVLLVLALKDIENEKYTEALKKIDEMPSDDMTNFVRPLLRGWLRAGELKEFVPEIEADDFTTVHTYHKALIGYYLGEIDVAEAIIDKTMSHPNITVLEFDRLADIYVAIGKKDKARKVYQDIYDALPAYEKAMKKIKAIDDKDDVALMQYVGTTSEIDSVKDGIAQALYDMAFILYQERSMTSTRIFASMALMMNKKHIPALGVLAETLVNFGRYDEAVGLLSRVSDDHYSYKETTRRIADILVEAEKYKRAEKILRDLYEKHEDVEALIKLGDLFRQKEKYAKALGYYNDAAEVIGEPVPEEYWYLLYARGMALEREGQWDKAEKDLLAALDYQPEHPYIMNYLGYGWADQGLYLERSLGLIERALKVLPRDGYITDSLGWVYYMSGQYTKSVPYLEQAVELLPYDATVNDHLGDAYWRVGRRIEARFQWERARGSIKNEEGLLEKVNEKLENGLPEEHETKYLIKEAEGNAADGGKVKFDSPAIPDNTKAKK